MFIEMEIKIEREIGIARARVVRVSACWAVGAGGSVPTRDHEHRCEFSRIAM